MNKNIRKITMPALLAFSLVGCGTPTPKIGTTMANAEAIEVFYENNCSACYQNAVNTATNHCNKHHKQPIPVRESYIPGRTVTTFICR